MLQSPSVSTLDCRDILVNGQLTAIIVDTC